MRVVFAGTPDFAVPALDALAAAGHHIVAVYTQPDRPAGRGRKLAASPVKQRALGLDVPVEQPETLKTPEALRALAAYAPDVMIVVAYGLLLPQAVLDLPRFGCLNIHASLLPRWRGAAPIQRAIQAGDAESGVCIMQMDKGLDTGPVLLCRPTPIGADETGGQLHDRLAALGADTIVEVLNGLGGGKYSPQAQDSVLATYASKLEKTEALLDWRRSALELERQVRAFNPWPVAFTSLEDETLRIHAAKALPLDSGAQAGEVLAATPQGIDVATGEGVLRLLVVQAPGKRAMNVAEFLNGHALVPGMRLAGTP